MRPSRLVLRGLTYYWRTHAAVVLGVATAVAVLAGALLVGDSVRGSLRDLVVQRLGRTDHIVTSSGYFREQLAMALGDDAAFAGQFSGICPMVVARGFVTSQSDGRRAGQVRVYGVDDRFWRFHGVSDLGGPDDGQAFVSPALARELAAEAGETILVRVQRPSGIPLESLFGRKDDLGRALRLDVRAVVPPPLLGEFSLEPQQGDVRAVFVPLAQLQRDLEIDGRVNLLLVSAAADATDGAAAVLARLVRRHAALDDLGLRIRPLDARRAIAIESEAGLLSDAHLSAVQRAAGAAGVQPQPVFTYLANTLRSGDREVPYSLVSAIDLSTIAPGMAAAEADRSPPIVVNDWLARELQVEAGDPITLEYYVWEDPGRLVTRTSEFRVAGVVPIDAGDRDLAPVYPGISDSPTLDDWDPPFPIDLGRVRPADEEYWKASRTTPKAFIPVQIGQQLWRSRYGSLTSIRIPVAAGERSDDIPRQYTERLRAEMDPLAMGLAIRDVRAESLEASAGATDFGEYFVYFSFFLVVSALLLAALFFKLSVEQRAREIGLLRAVGFGPGAVRRLFLTEGLVLSAAGSTAGVLGGVAYAWLMMAGLRTWWVDAVGTTALTLHVSPASLATGALGGLLAAMACIVATLRSLGNISERSLLAGNLTRLPVAPTIRAPRRYLVAAFGFAAAGVALVAAAVAGLAGNAGAFFGAGTAWLAACLCLFVFRLRAPHRRTVEGRGWIPIAHLGARNVTHRPGRSVLAIAVVASATFILIAVDAFRRDDRVVAIDRASGTGGYSLLVDTMFPIVHDPNTREGRVTLGLADLESMTIEPFRVLEGDDASCLNLYAPKNPRIVAPRDSFIAEGRFAFQASLASTEAERVNPWLLLNRAEDDGAVPVIGDANSMTYVLHRKIGEDVVMTRGDRTIRLRLVAALRDSIFQGELITSEAHFRRLFPDQEGYQLLLLDAPPERGAEVANLIEDALADVGADATGTVDRLAAFHKVENTYLSTFQALGGLGLLLGTLGLAAVLLRNALERRRELAMLGAVGYRRGHFMLMAVAENTLLLGGGLAAGAVCAALAIAPAVAERGGRLPLTSGGALLLFAVLVTGLLASLVATRAATRGPLLESLRSE
ncbi:MAG: ABC transporter permease [Acidobacteria bacterium]|nr:ABC transporter permease [Acidobacteriota bacterium]